MKGLDYQPAGEYEEIDYYENDCGVVFFHDMFKPYTEKELSLISKADVIYAVPPTVIGMNLFAKRAGVNRSGSWIELLVAIRTLARTLNKPMWVLSSGKDARILMPDRLRPLKLYGCNSTVAVWNDDGQYETIEQLTEGLSEKYNAVYDFCCGYGSSIRHFNYMIGSDINKKCLGYIKRAILEGINEQDNNTRHNAKQP